MLRVSGQGEPSARGGARGDLDVEVRVAEHPLFHREGLDLVVIAPVPISTAALGGEVEVPSLSGVNTVKVPPGTPPGRRIRVRGEGLPHHARPTTRGDLYVIIALDMPESPGRKVREALEALRAAERDETGPQRRHVQRPRQGTPSAGRAPQALTALPAMSDAKDPAPKSPPEPEDRASDAAPQGATDPAAARRQQPRRQQPAAAPSRRSTRSGRRSPRWTTGCVASRPTSSTTRAASSARRTSA